MVSEIDALNSILGAIQISKKFKTQREKGCRKETWDRSRKLTVENGGCLVSNNLKYIRITARGYREDKNRIDGEGWHLVLNNGWALDKVNENYLVRKLIP